MKFIATLLALIGSRPALSQTLVPVADSGGANWSAVIIIVAVVAAIAGMVVWHRRNPAGQEKALREANAALHAHISSLIAKIEHKAPAFEEVKQPSGPTQEQLAAIEAARIAYEKAKADAGVVQL